MIYGAFPVCRNYTVRAHVRNLGIAKRRGCENGIEYARSLRRGIHASHLHPRHTPDAGKRSRKDGKLYGTGTERRREYQAYPLRRSLDISPCGSGKFAARKSEQIKEKTGENLTIFTGLVELVAGLEPATC